jgi:hypothetical protein
MSEADDDGSPPVKGKFRPEMVEQTRRLYLLGQTDEEVANFFGVTPRTLYVWVTNRPEFREARELGKLDADGRVIESTFNRCHSHKVKLKKWMNTKEGPVEIEEEVHIPGDVKAQQFWLQNRHPDKWNKQAQAHAEKEAHKEQSLLELAKYLCFAVSTSIKEVEGGVTIDQPKAEPIPLEQKKEEDEE